MRISDWSSDVCSSDLAEVLELVNGIGRLAAHEFDGILVAEPVRTLDGVVHVPVPVVFAHVGQRGADAALRRHGMRPGRKELGEIGRASGRERVCQYVEISVVAVSLKKKKKKRK